MSGRRVAGIGQLGVRLALAFVAVALAAIAVNALISAEILGGDFDRLVRQQERQLSGALALTSAAAYGNMGWAHADLDPVYSLAHRAGAVVRVRDAAGRIVGSSPHFASLPPSRAHTLPVIEDGKTVGHVTARFDAKAAAAMVQDFEARRWHSRLIAGGIAAAIALVVSVAVALPITRPLERMIEAVRARGAGRRFVQIENPTRRRRDS